MKKIVEGKFVDFCGWHVCLASIWIDKGSIKADIVMWSDKFKKPISGGYSRGDRVRVGTSDCVYYLCEIKKFGRNYEKPGYIVLSTKKPEAAAARECLELESIEETTRACICDVEFGLGAIYKRKNDGRMVAQICPPLNSPLGQDFDVFEGDILWVGECAYKVEKIVKGGKKPDGKYRNGYVMLRKCSHLLPSESPVIPGELMSQPSSLGDAPFNTEKG